MNTDPPKILNQLHHKCVACRIYVTNCIKRKFRRGMENGTEEGTGEEESGCGTAKEKTELLMSTLTESICTLINNLGN